MVLFRKHPVAGPASMTLTMIALCGVGLVATSYAIDWTPLIPDGDGIVNGAAHREDMTYLATILVVLGAVVALAIMGGVALMLRSMLSTFRDALADERHADKERFDAACTTFTTECERQRQDHKEQRSEDRRDFDRRTDQMVNQLSDLPERLSDAVMRAVRVSA